MATADRDKPVKIPRYYAPALRHAYVAAVHLLLFAISFWLAYALRYEFRVPPFYAPIPDIVTPGQAMHVSEFSGVPVSLWSVFPKLLVFVLLVKLLVFGYFRLYAGWWQYVSIQDLIETFKSSHISTFLIIVGVYLFKGACRLESLRIVVPDSPQYPVPDVVLIIDWAATIALTGGLRFLVRIIREGSRPVSPAGLTRVAIVGAGDAGEGVLRELYRLPVEKYHVVAFVDDDPKKRGIRIHGVPVLGGVDDLASVADRLKVEEVIIALAQPTRDQLRRIIEVCKGRKLVFRIVPGMADLIDGRTDIIRLREVDINDLLGREPVSLDVDRIGPFLKDKVVLVTGAGGSIGSELCRQLLQFHPKRLVMLEQAENNLFYIERELRAARPAMALVPVIADVCDRSRIDAIFGRWRPDVVFHAAAHKHVPMMELNPGEAIKNNVFGTKNIADMACQYGAGAVVLISTDKAVNPTSVMGCTKRITEMYCQSLSTSAACAKTKFVAVRFGNVLGSAGSVVPIFREQIARGGPVTVTHPEMQRYFMTIPEATQLVIQAGTMGKGGEIMLLDMGEPVRILDLARNMITLSGFRPDEDIQIEFLGVRPGEKLFEELRTTSENVLPTHHKKVFIWQSRACTEAEMADALRRLEAVMNGASVEEVQRVLQSIVPEYQPIPYAAAPEGA